MYCFNGKDESVMNVEEDDLEEAAKTDHRLPVKDVGEEPAVLRKSWTW